jgi:hypothetical protein
MKAVANLNKLSLLDLANTNVSDAGARELTALPQLGKLHLSFTRSCVLYAHPEAA